jgi:UDP-N-acetylmuramoyl-L-alanyl-D-glutamate--2,6-diaminopimelate ligase
VVDYAHTDAGLRAVLEAVRQISDRKIALVFGCGGDRDVGKRPLMGRTAGELADLPIVTDDNPRCEDPHAIHSAIEEGLKQSGNRKYKIIPDRREAIRKAIAIARARQNWFVLIAGKGDESEQDLGDRVLPFSDRDEATRALLETEESVGQSVRR